MSESSSDETPIRSDEVDAEPENDAPSFEEMPTTYREADDAAPRPAHEGLFELLSDSPVKPGDFANTCSICFKPISALPIIKFLPCCGQWMDEACLRQHFATRNACPLCRQNIAKALVPIPAFVMEEVDYDGPEEDDGNLRPMEMMEPLLPPLDGVLDDVVPMESLSQSLLNSLLFKYWMSKNRQKVLRPLSFYVLDQMPSLKYRNVEDYMNLNKECLIGYCGVYKRFSTHRPDESHADDSTNVRQLKCCRQLVCSPCALEHFEMSQTCPNCNCQENLDHLFGRNGMEELDRHAQAAEVLSREAMDISANVLFGSRRTIAFPALNESSILTSELDSDPILIFSCSCPKSSPAITLQRYLEMEHEDRQCCEKALSPEILKQLLLGPNPNNESCCPVCCDERLLNCNDAQMCALCQSRWENRSHCVLLFCNECGTTSNLANGRVKCSSVSCKQKWRLPNILHNVENQREIDGLLETTIIGLVPPNLLQRIDCNKRALIRMAPFGNLEAGDLTVESIIALRNIDDNYDDATIDAYLEMRLQYKVDDLLGVECRVIESKWHDVIISQPLVMPFVETLTEDDFYDAKSSESQKTWDDVRYEMIDGFFTRYIAIDGAVKGRLVNQLNQPWISGFIAPTPETDTEHPTLLHYLNSMSADEFIWAVLENPLYLKAAHHCPEFSFTENQEEKGIVMWRRRGLCELLRTGCNYEMAHQLGFLSSPNEVERIWKVTEFCMRNRVNRSLTVPHDSFVARQTCRSILDDLKLVASSALGENACVWVLTEGLHYFEPTPANVPSWACSDNSSKPSLLLWNAKIQRSIKKLAIVADRKYLVSQDWLLRLREFSRILPLLPVLDAKWKDRLFDVPGADLHLVLHGAKGNKGSFEFVVTIEMGCIEDAETRIKQIEHSRDGTAGWGQHEHVETNLDFFCSARVKLQEDIIRNCDKFNVWAGQLLGNPTTARYKPADGAALRDKMVKIATQLGNVTQNSEALEHFGVNTNKSGRKVFLMLDGSTVLDFENGTVLSQNDKPDITIMRAAHIQAPTVSLGSDKMDALKTWIRNYRKCFKGMNLNQLIVAVSYTAMILKIGSDHKPTLLLSGASGQGKSFLMKYLAGIFGFEAQQGLRTVGTNGGMWDIVHENSSIPVFFDDPKDAEALNIMRSFMMETFEARPRQTAVKTRQAKASLVISVNDKKDGGARHEGQLEFFMEQESCAARSIICPFFKREVVVQQIEGSPDPFKLMPRATNLIAELLRIPVFSVGTKTMFSELPPTIANTHLRETHQRLRYYMDWFAHKYLSDNEKASLRGFVERKMVEQSEMHQCSPDVKIRMGKEKEALAKERLIHEFCRVVREMWFQDGALVDFELRHYPYPSLEKFKHFRAIIDPVKDFPTQFLIYLPEVHVGLKQKSDLLNEVWPKKRDLEEFLKQTEDLCWLTSTNRKIQSSTKSGRGKAQAFMWGIYFNPTKPEIDTTLAQLCEEIRVKQTELQNLQMRLEQLEISQQPHIPLKEKEEAE